MVDWGEALLVAVLGIGIVFIVLALIMGVLMLMEKIFAPKNEAPAKAQEVKQVKEAPKAAAQEVKTVDDSELIAVLTAAIAASLNTSTYNLKIKSYRKLGGTGSAWNNASRKENIYSRF